LAKQNRVSVRSVDDVIKEKYDNTATIQWNEIDIEVKHSLSFVDMLSFVKNVVEGCFEEASGTYMPELKPFLIKICTLAFYTNVAIPQNVNKKYELIYRTDIFDAVIKQVDRAQFTDMCNAIDENIDVIINAGRKELEKLNRVVEEIESVFSGIDGDTLKNLADALGDGGIDEEKLMKAIIDSKQKES